MAVDFKMSEHNSDFVFVLLENFSMICFANAVEPLRLANRTAGKELYRWKLCAENGVSARCSNGAVVNVDIGFEDLRRDQTIMLIGGVFIREATTKPVLTWLRKEARKGAVIGGLCTASYTMAKAGLLDNRRCTIHWENREAFKEEFPDLDITSTVYTIDRNRLCAAGGTASADLMLSLISRDHGPELSTAVADLLIYTSPRTDKDEQRLSIPTRIGVRHPKLASVIHMMEDNLEEPISPSILASEVGMSTRQLERLFRRYLNRSPKRYYMELRLQKARNLLLQTDMSVINVALACGFTSPSHFSKCYRAHFETTPYRERGSQAALDEATVPRE